MDGVAIIVIRTRDGGRKGEEDSKGIGIVVVVIGGHLRWMRTVVRMREMEGDGRCINIVVVVVTIVIVGTEEMEGEREMTRVHCYCHCIIVIVASSGHVAMLLLQGGRE